MQVDRGALEKEMEERGLDMTDKDDVRNIFACLNVIFKMLIKTLYTTVNIGFYFFVRTFKHVRSSFNLW